MSGFNLTKHRTIRLLSCCRDLSEKRRLATIDQSGRDLLNFEIQSLESYMKWFKQANNADIMQFYSKIWKYWTFDASVFTEARPILTRIVDRCNNYTADQLKCLIGEQISIYESEFPANLIEDLKIFLKIFQN